MLGCLRVCASGKSVGELEGWHCIGVHKVGKTERDSGKEEMISQGEVGSLRISEERGKDSDVGREHWKGW